MSIIERKARPAKNKLSLADFELQLKESVAISSGLEPKSLKRAASFSSDSPNESAQEETSISTRRPFKKIKVEEDMEKSGKADSDWKENGLNARLDAIPDHGRKVSRDASSDGGEEPAATKVQVHQDKPRNTRATSSASTAPATPTQQGTPTDRQQNKSGRKCSICREAGHQAPKCAKAKVKAPTKSKAVAVNKKEPEFDDEDGEEEGGRASPILEED